MATTPAFYRSVDPIDNLVVRVSVRKRKAANAPTIPSASHPNGEAPVSTVPAAGYDDERAEHVGEFAWQQKVFGPRELLRYAHAADELKSGRRLPHGTSPLEREYIAAVQKFLDAGEWCFYETSKVLVAHSNPAVCVSDRRANI
jgi:hypothetical protein